jgi:superfamily II DNA or RNA helicase
MDITIANSLIIRNLPADLRKVLMERLKFENPKWVENHRMGRWNKGIPRVLKFYDKLKGDGLLIPRGYLRQLILLCRQSDVAYHMDDRRRSLPEVDFRFSGKLKAFQQQAVEAMLSKDFGTLNAPTGSGKTIMALYMLAQRKQPALILVHTRELMDQWTARIEEFLNIPGHAVGMIGGGVKRVGEAVTVALVQSMYKCAEEVADRTGFLIVDECHRCPSRTFTDAVVAFDSRYMLGLSATPFRRDNLSNLIFWHLGDIHHKVDMGLLVETGDVLAARVIFRETEFSPFYSPVSEYAKMLSELTANDQRNRLIAADIAREVMENDGVCLVLSDRKKHCQILFSLLHYKYEMQVRLFTGDLTAKERREILDELDDGQIRVLIATGQLIGEGFDNKHLSPLFLTTPIRFSGRVLQYVGRVLRPAPGKKQAVIYDYVDVKVDVLRAAAKARQKIYASEYGR